MYIPAHTRPPVPTELAHLHQRRAPEVRARPAARAQRPVHTRTYTDFASAAGSWRTWRRQAAQPSPCTVNTALAVFYGTETQWCKWLFAETANPPCNPYPYPYPYPTYPRDLPTKRNMGRLPFSRTQTVLNDLDDNTDGVKTAWMRSHTKSPKVLIVGAGPSGLILALTLRRNGIPVRVIEKTTEHRKGQRGAGILPRSLEVFSFLGLLPQVTSRSTDIPMLRMYKMPEGHEILSEFRMAPMLDPTPSTPYINPQVLGQDNLDKILRAELSKTGCEVELGVELHHLEQFDDHVKVSLLKHNLDGTKGVDPLKEEASYDWVIGSDGAKGAVRKELGLKLLGETTPYNFIAGDFRLEGLENDIWHMWGNMTETFISIRPTETPGVFNFFISAPNLEERTELYTGHEAVMDFIRANIGQRAREIIFGEILYLSPGRINIRMAETFRKGRAFLIGDAGHVHSMTGGQDGFNLGWKLALVMKGYSDPSFLDTFTEERLPVVAQMLQITEKILETTVAESSSQTGWDRSGHLNQLGVNYRWSSIVLDEERQLKGPEFAKISTYDADPKLGLYAGDRAPDAPGLVEVGSQPHETANETRLFDLFSPTHHTLLIFTDKPDFRSVLADLDAYPADLVRIVVILEKGTVGAVQNDAKTPIILEDRDGHAYSTYMQADATRGIYIIRPDSVIGARVGALEVAVAYKRSKTGVESPHLFVGLESAAQCLSQDGDYAQSYPRDSNGANLAFELGEGLNAGS
ncbi:FAD binding domain-containing protein [Pholiota molesta]|nr:FAD binding domain-containing protein [Pholiota molesta]